MDDVADLRRIVFEPTRRRVFGSAEVTPLRTLEPGLHLLRLSKGRRWPSRSRLSSSSASF
jgi:hypothetical protein